MILGALGCGVYGLDPERVAGIFHQVLIDECFGKHFDTIIFAILCRNMDDSKLKSFGKVFAVESSRSINGLQIQQPNKNPYKINIPHHKKSADY